MIASVGRRTKAFKPSKVKRRPITEAARKDSSPVNFILEVRAGKSRVSGPPDQFAPLPPGDRVAPVKVARVSSRTKRNTV